MKTCTLDGCDRAHRARGLCSSHYNQEHAPNRHAKKMTACAWCGTEVLKNSGGSKARRPTCSNECRASLTPPRSEVLSHLPGDHWARWYGKTSAWPRYPMIDCAQCEATFLPKSTNAKYCSRRCMWTWHERQAGARSQAEIAEMPRQCGRCSTTYQHVAINRVHCSDLCRDLAKAERGSQLFHGWIADSVRVSIYQRDGYMCWLCNDSVDMNANPQRDDWAPSLDHVTPRSKGGTHDPSNLRTAHRWCNAVRGDSDLYGLFAAA